MVIHINNAMFGLLAGFLIVGAGTTIYLSIHAIVFVHREAMKGLRRRRDAAGSVG